MKKILCISCAIALNFYATSSFPAQTNQDKVNSSFGNIERNASDSDIYEVTVLNEPFLASKDVFSPKYFKSTEMLTTNFPFKDKEKFLEVGCGIGVAAIIAAKKYDNQVMAVDINPVAVKLTSLNALKHDLASRITVKQSDVFSAVPSHEKFDTIFWDLPYVYTDASEDLKLSMLQKSVSDPGYQHIAKFLSQARDHIQPNGRIIVGFGSNGDFERFSTLLKKHHYQFTKIYEGYHPYREGITYQLFLLSDAQLS